MGRGFGRDLRAALLCPGDDVRGHPAGDVGDMDRDVQVLGEHDVSRDLHGLAHNGLAHDAEIYPMSRLEERQLELERMIAERTQELAEANRQLEMLSNTDGLTNIGNRRIFDKTLIQEWNRALRAETPLALVMLDIDHFKQFNDLYGHLAGDGCLQSLAYALAQSGRRSGELVARYGGEEFVILLPNIDQVSAYEVAQHVQQLILSLALPHAQTATGIVSVSIGVASLIPSSEQQPAKLVQLADAALYEAKLSGRNCIRVAE